jgi:phosphoenolpyruvate carboxykinase (ATP)
VVEEPGSESRIWWGPVNQPLSEEHFEGLREKVVDHLERQDLYVVDAFAGADPTHRISVRVITDRPDHALFA